MNHPLPCRLTTKDHAILETLLERCPEPGGAYAALTYVAGFLSAVGQLLYFVMLFAGGRRN